MGGGVEGRRRKQIKRKVKQLQDNRNERFLSQLACERSCKVRCCLIQTDYAA